MHKHRRWILYKLRLSSLETMIGVYKLIPEAQGFHRKAVIDVYLHPSDLL